MSGASIRLLIADDQALVRGALSALLGLEPDIDVVAEVGRGDEVVDAAASARPDVALLDIEMPGLNGIDAAAARPEEAELLGIPAGAPVLRIARRAFAGSIALEVSRSTFRADRYTLWMPLSRPNTPVTPSR